MAVFNEVVKTDPVVANGTDVDFFFDFYIESTAWLKVYVLTEGVQTLMATDSYTIHSSAVQNVDGGKVTFDDPPAADSRVVFKSEPPTTQESDLENIGAYSPETVEDALDKLTYILASLKETLSRAILNPITSDPIDFEALLAAIQAAAGYAAAALQYSLDAKEWYELTKALGFGELLAAGTKVLTFADSPYTVTADDKNFILACDTSGGAITINFPSIATEGEPFVFAIRKDTEDANAVTGVRNGTDTINDIAANHVVASFKELIFFYAQEDPAPDNWGVIRIGLQPGDVIWKGWIDASLSNPDSLATFIPGVTSTFSLTQDPGTSHNVSVYVDRLLYPKNHWSLSGTTLTLDEPVPLGAREVWIRIGAELAVGVPGTGTIGPNQITDDVGILTDVGGSIAWPWTDAFDFEVTLDGNHAFAAPSPARVGTRVLKVIQDGTGNRVPTWDAVFKTTPTLTTTAGHWDMVAVYCDRLGNFYARIFEADVS